MLSRRHLLVSAAAAALMPAGLARAADKPGSMVLKDKGLLEKEFEKDGIGIRWVQSLGSNKALEFLNAGSIDFGSTAGSAALLGRINGNPVKSIYVFSRPEWTALVTRKDTPINKIEDLKGKRVAVTRGTDPHIFLVRALLSVGMSEKDIQPVLLQHPDGKVALIRGDVDAWAGLDPMMAAAQVEEGAGRENQPKEPPQLTFNRVGPEQRDSILQAGLALQQASVIPANVDVKQTLNDLVDDRYVGA